MTSMMLQRCFHVSDEVFNNVSIGSTGVDLLAPHPRSSMPRSGVSAARGVSTCA